MDKEEDEEDEDMEEEEEELDDVSVSRVRDKVETPCQRQPIIFENRRRVSKSFRS